MIDLTNIITAVLTLIVALVTTFLIPYIKSVVDEKKLETIRTWVKVAVEAAEQIYVGTGNGERKKEYVLRFLNEKGYTVDTNAIDNLIESAVYNLKN